MQNHQLPHRAHANTPFLLALNHIPHVGPQKIIKWLKIWPNLQDLFSQSATKLEAHGIAAPIAQQIATFTWHKVDHDLRWQASASQHHIITWWDEAYPQMLREIHAPPPVLYAYGNLEALTTKPMLAMVGSRKPTPVGAETAFHFAKTLSSHGTTIVSGLALGIDGAAHRGCLAANGTTIAVLGSGLNHIYPRQHQTLAQQIADRGLIISEFARESSPIAGHFPRRNRIISGLASSVLVVEAAIKSGSLITARYALEQNRDVLAIPGSIHNPQTAGCHHLLKQGAKLVSQITDVLEELTLDPAVTSHSSTARHASLLADDQQTLVACIGFEMTSIAQIFERCYLDLEQLMCRLAELELLGIIRAVPGGYTRCMYER